VRSFKPILITAGLLAGLAAWAQDPVKTLPKNYWVEFENSNVRVVHVHYAAREALPGHDHPKTPTLDVYLADAGPVRFKHTGANPYVLDRPPIKQGGFRLNPGVLEEHEVENISCTPSNFLRVEFKTIPFKRTTLRGHFPAAQKDFWSVGQPRQIVFEDQNLRITRLGYLPGANSALPAAREKNAIDIALRDGEMHLGTAKRTLHPGEAWVIQPIQHLSGMWGANEIEILRVELKAHPGKEPA
jgi:hypothetical protein